MIFFVAIGALIIAAGAVVVGYAIGEAQGKTSNSAADRIALRSVLLLQQALTDPTIRQTTKWEDDAQAIIDSYRKENDI